MALVFAIMHLGQIIFKLSLAFPLLFSFLLLFSLLLLLLLLRKVNFDFFCLVLIVCIILYFCIDWFCRFDLGKGLTQDRWRDIWCLMPRQPRWLYKGDPFDTKDVYLTLMGLWSHIHLIIFSVCLSLSVFRKTRQYISLRHRFLLSC